MKCLKILGLALILSAHAWSAHAAEKFPSKPIRMLVPFSPGSQTDILARWIGEKITESSGQQVVVDNRPSAGARIN
jgi:tripartite-type tricarboxylate transporter receptor subunit TctC